MTKARLEGRGLGPRTSRLLSVVISAAFLLMSIGRAFAQVPGDGPVLSPRQLADNLAAKRYLGHRVDLVFSKAGLQDVIAHLEKAGGIPLKLDPAVNDPVTYRMLDIPWDEALATVLSDNGLGYMMNLDGSGLKIGRGERIVLAFPDGSRAKAALFLYNNLFRIAIGVLILAIIASGIWIFVRRRARMGTEAKKSLMSAEVAEQVKNALTRLLEEERVYRDDALTLQSLAEKLGVTPHRLSWLLNEELRVTFTSLINVYRIEEVKSRLADSSCNGESILQTAMEAGFHSKASFNRAFKLNTGMTPSEYKRHLAR